MSNSHIKLLDWFYGNLEIIPDPTYYWRCNEQSGNLIDTQGALDLPEVGTVPQTTPGWRGVFSLSNYFRHEALPDAKLNINTNPQFLMSMQIKTVSTNDNIFDKEKGLQIATATFSSIGTVQIKFGGSNALEGSSEIQDGDPHWIQIGTIAGSDEVRLYVDGVLEDTSTNDSPSSQESILTVGVATPGNSEAFNGEVNEMFYIHEHTVTDWNVIEVAFQALRAKT